MPNKSTTLFRQLTVTTPYYYSPGYQLNTDVLSVLTLRYMRKDGTLRFGDFVSAVLHLSIAFNIYETRDPLQNGTIKLTLSEVSHSQLRKLTLSNVGYTYPTDLNCLMAVTLT